MTKIRAFYARHLETLIIGLLLLTIFNVFANVVLRYAFNNSSIALQEMQWHLFSAMFLLGISYTLQHDAHVRVDIFYAKFARKKQALINIIGFILFILPISILIIYFGIDFTYQAFSLNEQSGDPGGLAYRFLIKSLIPISFILLIISGFMFTADNYKILKQ
jgi:TRAP-type mannitol/chloroaromatic compound transport system permease small subunit